LAADKAYLKILLMVFAVAVGARWCGILLFPHMKAAPDAIYEYDPIAWNVLSGKGFVHANGEPDSIRGPGYPLFLAAIYKTIGGNHAAVRFMQSTLDGITAVLVAHLTWILWRNRKRAIIAGLILSLYPLSIYSSNLVAAETVFGFAFFLSVFFFINGCRKEQWSLFVISGMLLAYSALIRSTSLLFPLVMAVWLFAFKGISKTNACRCACLLLAFAAVLAPWSIRNYSVFHEFIAASTNGGANFYLGSSLEYLKTDEERKQASKIGDIFREMADKGIRSPKKQDQYLWDLGWQNYENAWSRNPLEVAKLAVYKAVRFWYATDSGRQEKSLVIIQIALLLASLFGILGAAKIGQCPAEMWLLVISVLYFWLVFIVMVPLARYTIPVIPMLAIFASLNFKKSSFY
jgi:4-amino-4-deoxy-L-arabinose transferase-like glycosyltransferase